MRQKRKPVASLPFDAEGSFSSSSGRRAMLAEQVSEMLSMHKRRQ